MPALPPATPWHTFVRGPFTLMTFDDQLRGAFDMLTDRLQADIRREVQSALDALATAQAAREEAMRETEERHREHARVSGTAAAERLLDAVRSIGRARSLSETLDTLV